MVGAGVVGCATALELRRRGASVALLEAEAAPGLAASGTNSGILHTGFDSDPGELETELILRSGKIRDAVTDGLAIPVLRCGAVLRPEDAEGRETVARLARGRGAQRRLRARGRGWLARGAGRVGDRSGGLHARAGVGLGQAGRERVDALARGRDPRGGRRPGAARARRRPAPLPRGRELRRAPRRRGGRSRRRPVASRSIRARASSSSSTPATGSPWTRSCCPFPPRGPRGCWCSRPSTARWWRDRRRSTRRTRTTGRCAARPPARSSATAVRMYPPLEGAEPVASYAGLRPAGRGVNYVIGVSRQCAATRERGRDQVHRTHGVARDRRERVRRGARSGRRARRARTAAAARAAGRAHRRRPVVAAIGAVPRLMTRPLLLGIDEGTSAVKAVAYDTDLRPVAEARRDKPLDHPAGRMGRAGSARRARGGGGRGGRGAERSRRRGGGVRARPPGRIGARLGGRGGRAAHADRDLAGQALAGGARPARGGGARGRGARAQRPSPRPVLLGRQARLAAGARAGRRHARSTPGTLRLGTVDAWLCDVLGAGFATDASTASRTQLSIPGRPAGTTCCSRRSACPAPRFRRSATAPGRLGTLRHPDWSSELPLCAQVVDQQAALAGAGCVSPGRVKATYGTGVFVLAHAGDSRPDAARGRPPPHGRVEDRRPGGVRPRRRGVHGGRIARMAEPRPGSGRRPARARRAWRPRSRTATAFGYCPRSPDSALHGGGRRRGR